MNGFHGVNGTAASDTHWLSYMNYAAVVITGAQSDIGQLSNTESVPGDL